MGFKETLHNIVHREEFDHRPTLDELKEPQIVGGRELPPLPTSLLESEREKWDAIADELPEVPSHLRHMHTRHQLMWQLDQVKQNRLEQETGTSSTDPRTEELEKTVYDQWKDGPEWC